MKRAAFAENPKWSRGRFYEEARDDFRSPFQRDRDRIVHSTAFRRLAHKTQVFVAHEGDLFRSRLTHSLEVAQVARALSRRLGLDEDLTEAVALAHDLGHPPFGHTGEDALGKMMQNYGGFDHNAQALRLVSKREERYANFDGLNLTWESLEGIAKHNGPVQLPVPWAMRELSESWDLELSSHASLEAQIAAIADDIAYNHHDLQDGLRSGLISEDQLKDVPLMASALEEVQRLYPKASVKIHRYEALSRLFSAMVEDVYAETLRNLAFDPHSSQDIRTHNRQIVRFSEDFFAKLKVLRQFLFEHLYRHELVMQMREIASKMIERAFEYAFERPDILPIDWRKDIDIEDETERARLVCDYISGMTDHYLSAHWQFAHKLHWEINSKKT